MRKGLESSSRRSRFPRRPVGFGRMLLSRLAVVRSLFLHTVSPPLSLFHSLCFFLLTPLPTLCYLFFSLNFIRGNNSVKRSQTNRGFRNESDRPFGLLEDRLLTFSSAETVRENAHELCLCVFTRLSRVCARTYSVHSHKQALFYATLIK